SWTSVTIVLRAALSRKRRAVFSHLHLGGPRMAQLESYSFGRIVVDGDEQTRDLIVLPGRVVTDWWRRDGHSLAMEDLDGVLDELPERLILGCGHDGRLHPPAAVIEELERRGIA